MGISVYLYRVRGPDRGLLVLALIALSFLLIRPVCAAWEAHGERPAASAAIQGLASSEDAGRDDPCCSSIDDAPSLAPAAAGMPDAKLSAAVVLKFAPRLLAVNGPPAGTAPPRASPPRPLDYHARSTRILS